jgi:dUTP pyrophosphatase
MEIEIKKVRENAIIPKYQTEGAAGFDLSSCVYKLLAPGETAVIPTGLAFELPFGVELRVQPRSGLSLKTKLRVTNSPGCVDSDFRGEVGIIVENTGSKVFEIFEGDRIAQGIVSPVIRAVFKEVETLSDTSRGSGAYGSTGV